MHRSLSKVSVMRSIFSYVTIIYNYLFFIHLVQLYFREKIKFFKHFATKANVIELVIEKTIKDD